MGGKCSQVSETQCDSRCDVLEKCYTCEETGIGDQAGMIRTGCHVQNGLLFAAVILPLIIFFTIIGVYILNKSRIKRSTNINSCLRSMGDRQWGVTAMYIAFELCVLFDIYFWIRLFVGRPDQMGGNFLFGIILFIMASCFACCGCCKYVCHRQQEQASVNMSVVMASDPSMPFATPVNVVSGQAPIPVVSGYPVSGGYYFAPMSVGGAPSQVPSQVGQPAIAPSAAPVSGGGVFRYPMSDDHVYHATPITASQVVHGSSGDYLLPAAYAPIAASPTTASKTASTTALGKEDF
jgi:hypothetical protein